jgi:hypothetical protein
MLNRAERFGISKLVRKLSDEGRATVRSSSTFGSGCPFFHFLFFFVPDVARLLLTGASSTVLSFLPKKRFILALMELAKVI